MIAAFETLATAYRAALKAVCGDAGITAANEALKTARLAIVTHRHSATIPVGTYVLIWRCGLTRQGEEALTGWHPCLGLELFHQAEYYTKAVAS